MTVQFAVPGAPQGKARPRVVRNQYSGRVIAFTPEKTAEYESLIRKQYIEAARITPGCELPARQLRIIIEAFYAIPKRTTKTMRQLMEENRIRPSVKPDWDNIGKAVCDALNGIAYRDDSQIVDAVCRKFYGTPPRVEVTISDITEV